MIIWLVVNQQIHLGGFFYYPFACERRVNVFLAFPSGSKEQLLYLCSELETHVKCDIRESEKCLYRSKVSMFDLGFDVDTSAV